MIKFDIILPTIGRDSLKAAIDSVIAQSYTEWNLWIMSNQGSVSWTTNLDDRIIPYNLFDDGKQYVPDWGAASRNIGIRSGINDWIAYIDDDDEWLPHHLETIVSVIEDHNMVRTAGQSFMMRHRSPRSSKRVRKMGPVNDTDILTVGMAHTRSLFNKTLGWQPCDNHDHLLWKEMLAAGGQAYESKEVTFHFRR